jgi:hypothetical protein
MDGKGGPLSGNGPKEAEVGDGGKPAMWIPGAKRLIGTDEANFPYLA